jgi:hypothetical protein
MGKRTWLDRQLATEYFPAIAQLPNTEAGHTSAATLAVQLRQSWYDRGSVKPGEKELSQLAALFDITRSQLKATFGIDHFSLNYFGMTPAEYTQLNNQKQANTANRNENVKQIDNPDAIVAKAVALLEDSRNWFDLAAALAVLTGRRSSEILATAQFAKATQWSVMFTGALKRGGERQRLSFEIPTLTTADRVITALATIRRELPEASGLPPEDINRKYGDRVVTACEQHFHGLVPPRADGDLYTHLFRAVYATIATFWYCPSWVEATEYRAAIQGHYAVLDADDPTLRRSLTASRHYADYEIADRVIAKAGGKRKGIKLGWGGVQPLQIFQRSNQEATLAPSDLTPTPDTQAMPTPVAQPSKRTPRKSLWINYQDQDLAQQVLSHFGTTDTTEAKIAALSRWLRWSLEKLEAQTQPEPDRDRATHTPRAASDRPEDGDELASPDQAQPVPPTTPLTAMPAQDNSDLGELKTMFAQTLEMFQSLMQAQTQPATHNGDDALAKPATRASANPDRDSVAASDRSVNPNSAPSTSATAAPNIRRQSRSKSPEAATETTALTQQLFEAIEQIKRYNLYIDQTQQPHRLKREITTNFLKALTPNQRLINRILEEHQADLQQHHQQMHIQPGHNSSYREKITLFDIQQTLQAGDRLSLRDCAERGGGRAPQN